MHRLGRQIGLRPGDWTLKRAVGGRQREHLAGAAAVALHQPAVEPMSMPVAPSSGVWAVRDGATMPPRSRAAASTASRAMTR